MFWIFGLAPSVTPWEKIFLCHWSQRYAYFSTLSFKIDCCRLYLELASVQRKCLLYTAAAAAKLLQSCLTLCDPIDGSPPGSPVPGILQARTLEWVAISFSNAWKWKVKEKSLSRARLFATPWTAAYQASLSMGFSRQEYWSGVPSPSPRHSRTNTKKRCPFHHRGLECTRFTC